MDSDSRGIAWVGNIYPKFEAMCIGVGDIMCQDPFRCVENHLQTVGTHVRQFCSELMQEVLPSSPTHIMEELNSSPVLNAGATASENSKLNVDEDHSHKELIRSSSVGSIGDVHFGLSLEQSTEDEGPLPHFLGSIPSESVILAQVCKNELQDIDCILDDTSLETTEDASHKSIRKVLVYTFPAVEAPVVEPVGVELETVPSFDKVKLEESCIIVDSTELHSLSNEAVERRSYKKKLQEAFSCKSRFIKRDRERHEGPVKEKGNGVGQSRGINKTESREMGFCESDWEII